MQALSELCFHSHIQCSKLCKEIVSRVDVCLGKVDPLTVDPILCFSRNNATSMWRSHGVLCDDGMVLIFTLVSGFTRSILMASLSIQNSRDLDWPIAKNQFSMTFKPSNPRQ